MIRIRSTGIFHDVNDMSRVQYRRNTVHLYKGLSGLMLIGSTPIFSSLQCIHNLTFLCSPFNLTLSSDELYSFDYPPMSRPVCVLLHEDVSLLDPVLELLAVLEEAVEHELVPDPLQCLHRLRPVTVPPLRHLFK